MSDKQREHAAIALDTAAIFDPANGTPNSDVVLLEQEGRWGAQLVRTASSSSSTDYQGMIINARKRSRVLTLGLVLPIYYFLSSGGPSGVEPVVASGGPFIGLATLVVFPMVFSAPLGLLISELCTAFPDDGGFVIWVTNAFGPFWGFQEGFLSWVSIVLNNALYPSFVIGSLSNVVGAISNTMVEYVIKVVMVVVISLPTLFGTKIVGKASLFFVVLVLVPFILATGVFYSKAKDFGVLTQLPTSNSTTTTTSDKRLGSLADVDWKSLIRLVFWCYDNIYIVSLFGGQISNPAYTYPRAIFYTLLLSVVTYVVPLAGALTVNSLNWSTFGDDAMQLVAEKAVGSWLRNLLILSVVVSNIGMFTTATFAQCYQVNGMAAQGLIPKAFSKRHYFFETPYLALVTNTVPVLFLLGFDIETLLKAANCMSSASQVLIIAAAIKLRIMHRDMYQFNKFPGGNPMVILSMIIPMTVVGFVFVISFDPIAAGIVVVSVLYGLVRFH